MKAEKVILLLGGIACIAAFFLPYLHIGGQSIHGYGLLMTALDYFDLVEYQRADMAIDLFANAFDQVAGWKGYGQLAMLSVVLIGPLLFAIFGITYVIRALAGKQYRKGVFLNLLFLGFAWLTFYLIQEQNTVHVLGMDIGAKLNFFKMAGIGYWVAFAGMMVAAFSLFFGKTE